VSTLSASLESHFQPALRAIQLAAVELAKGAANPLPASCSHSEDFRAIKWYGEPFTFTPPQAHCVQCLWSAVEKGWLGVSKEDLIKVSETESNNVKDIFKNSKAWKKIIVSVGRGVYSLKKPSGCTSEP
jgi:hypothetical protein